MHISHIETISSTHEYLLELMAKITPMHGFTISTDFQTAGRGQIGRSWHSQRAKNVLMSMVVYPIHITPPHQFQLNIAVSLAIIDLLQYQYQLEDVSIKWPNDIYVGDKKIAGILIQNQISGHTIKASLIGIGLNVNQQTWPSDIPNPTSILIVSQKSCEVPEVVEGIRNEILQKIEEFRLLDLQALKTMYESNLYRKGMVSKFEVDDEEISGTIVGVNDNGELLLCNRNNIIQAYSFRAIRYVI